MTSVACIIIASEPRKGLVFDAVLPSVLRQGFDEVVLVHDWPHNTFYIEGKWRDVRVGPVQRNTLDALLKRDAGTLATTSKIIVYLCDDHALAPNFLTELRSVLAEDWDVLVPNRYTLERTAGAHSDVGILHQLNTGEAERYCGGHAMVVRRELVEALPWMSFAYGPWEHTRVWDVTHSHELQRRGANFVWRPRSGIAIEDLEPKDPRHYATT